ncbi:MAG: hypothetical protein ACPG5U_08240 [Planktomarina sp.]
MKRKVVGLKGIRFDSVTDAFTAHTASTTDAALREHVSRSKVIAHGPLTKFKMP